MRGKCPGPRARISKHSFTAFSCFRLFTTRQHCRAFWLLRLVHKLRKLKTLEFTVFEWFERIEPNSITLYDPRIRSKSVHPWASAKFFQGGKNLILFRLLTMQCKWTFTKRFTVSTSLICAEWTSILNLLSKNVFSTPAIRNAISFHKLPNINFSSTFYN